MMKTTSFNNFTHYDREEINDNREYLNTDRISEFLTTIREKELFKHNFSDSQILDIFNTRKNRHLTKAGALIFSKYPQMYFPQIYIEAKAHPGTVVNEFGAPKEYFLDFLNITGSIPDMLEQSIEFIRKNIRKKTIINSFGQRNDRYDYPLAALREAVINALVHRDYSTLTESKPISLDIFKDRIEIVSPGGLYPSEDVSYLGKKMMSLRNPDLIKILEILKIANNRYLGIPIMRQEMKSLNLPEPKFENSENEFKVTFYNFF